MAPRLSSLSLAVFGNTCYNYNFEIAQQCGSSAASKCQSAELNLQKNCYAVLLHSKIQQTEMLVCVRGLVICFLFGLVLSGIIIQIRTNMK